MLHGLAVIGKPPDSAYCSLVPVKYLPARLSIFHQQSRLPSGDEKNING
jgi:hypothetical protein